MYPQEDITASLHGLHKDPGLCPQMHPQYKIIGVLYTLVPAEVQTPSPEKPPPVFRCDQVQPERMF